MSKFILERSESTPGRWTLSCPDYGITISFEEHRFYETQKVTLSDQSVVQELGPQGVARIMSEAGDWLSTHAYSVAMPTPVFESRIDDREDKEYILRNTFPKFRIEVREECTAKQLADALRAASEFVRKRTRDE